MPKLIIGDFLSFPDDADIDFSGDKEIAKLSTEIGKYSELSMESFLAIKSMSLNLLGTGMLFMGYHNRVLSNPKSFFVNNLTTKSGLKMAITKAGASMGWQYGVNGKIDKVDVIADAILSPSYSALIGALFSKYNGEFKTLGYGKSSSNILIDYSIGISISNFSMKKYCDTNAQLRFYDGFFLPATSAGIINRIKNE
jgi:hypothetical protein